MTDFIQARAHDLESRTVGDQLILLDLRSQTYLSLNRTGAELWPLMVEGVERQRLVETLQERHNLVAPVAERDVDALLRQLREADLLERMGTGAAADA
jgi:hypothetical protein